MTLSITRSLFVAVLAASLVVAARDAVAQSAPQPAAAPARKAAPVKPATAESKAYRIDRVPAWVKPAPPVPAAVTPTQAGSRARREVLFDTQVQLAFGNVGQQIFTRHRRAAFDTTALGDVSKAEIYFNPAYQTLQIH